VGALLQQLRATDRNFDPSELDAARGDKAWRADRYQRQLGREPSGDPVHGGPWSIASELSVSYAFVDPSIVRAIYDPSEPLELRTLLLEVQFWGLRIYVGVRVGAVYDVQRTERGRPVRVRGWGYDTLAGHFEQGRICYEVCKRLDTGAVDFRIEALSRRADPANLLVAAGFILFGRRKQTEFARTACERMARLTLSQARNVAHSGVAGDDLVVGPDSEKETGPQRLSRRLGGSSPK
jgi:uncharacterized protein (UPF0548 family)